MIFYRISWRKLQAITAFAFLLLIASNASAQSLFGGDDETPIEVNAEGGIEWQQDSSVFIARGNAVATRGDATVKADELRAYYREGSANASDGKANANEIWRIDAVGSVTVTSAGWKATGGHAIYDVAGAVIILKDANPITLVSGSDKITATKQMEFWSEKKMAVARGNATAIREDRSIKADVLSAHMETAPGGENRVKRIEAFDRVKVISADSVASSNRAAYDVVSGLARLEGAVVIERGQNKLSGCSADFDLNTGISRLKSCPGAGGTKGRVKGILLPGAK